MSGQEIHHTTAGDLSAAAEIKVRQRSRFRDRRQRTIRNSSMRHVEVGQLGQPRKKGLVDRIGKREAFVQSQAPNAEIHRRIDETSDS